MAMLTSKKEAPIKKKVLLFSGGMDSFMMDFLLKPDINLYLTSGSSYDEAQLQAIHRLPLTGSIMVQKPFKFASMERDDLIVPSRNAYFLLMAANYGDDIYFGKVFGDRSSDKSKEFIDKMHELFDILYAPQHWCEGRTVRIHTPYSEMTKTQLVSAYLSAGGSVDALVACYSCYSGHQVPCGHCKPCFRKWVALQNNGIQYAGHCQGNPWEAPWLQELLPQIQAHQYRGPVEDGEILNALALTNLFPQLEEAPSIPLTSAMKMKLTSKEGNCALCAYQKNTLFEGACRTCSFSEEHPLWTPAKKPEKICRTCLYSDKNGFEEPCNKCFPLEALPFWKSK